jgi:hypothetical protein
MYDVDTRNKNIQVGYEKGKVKYYLTKSTEDLKIPSLGFDTEEEAELAVAVAKALKAYGKDISNLSKEMIYVLRVLGIKNGWTE